MAANKQRTEIKTPVGRLVSGHPMESKAVTDQKTNLPKMQRDGVTPMIDYYCGLAIAKGHETHWNQTVWGKQIQAVGVAGWPAGEHGALTFAWKITDGDSPVPNKKGRKPCEREGWPGHWIIGASTGIAIKCYHTGKLDPTQQIQNPNEIKRGDYAKLLISACDNSPSESPGVYLNPSLFVLVRAGIEIVVEGGASAQDTFGDDGVDQLPAGALVDTAVGGPAPSSAAAVENGMAPAPGPAVEPAADILNTAAPAPAAVKSYHHAGAVYTEAQLVAGGWSPEQIAGLLPA